LQAVSVEVGAQRSQHVPRSTPDTRKVDLAFKLAARGGLGQSEPAEMCIGRGHM
jgi:hypothetical protein